MKQQQLNKHELVKTYFYIPQALWKKVELFNDRMQLSSEAAATRFLITLALKNEKSFRFTKLPKKMTTRGLAFQIGLRENVFKFQHRHAIEDKQTAYCQLIQHGLVVMKQLME